MFRTKSRKLTLSTLFGVAIFILKIILPAPLDKFLFAPQVLFLAFGSLLMEVYGAIFVSLVSGSLTALLKPSTALTNFVFSLIYGLLVDIFILGFKVKTPERTVRLYRIIASLALSSAIIGVLSYYTAVILEIAPFNTIIMLVTLLSGVINGSIAGYLTEYIWRKKLYLAT